jgi:hypothetical protein
MSGAASFYFGTKDSPKPKKEIPVVAQVISSRASLFDMDGMKNLKWARAKLPSR